MPAIELPRAVEDWKKVKPLTLTQTGISDQLRKLQNYKRPVQAAGIAEAKRVLNDVLVYVQQQTRNKHVEKHEKALRWLKELADQLARENSALNMLEGQLRALEEKRRKEQEAQSKLEELRQNWLSKLGALKIFFDNAERNATQLLESARNHAGRAASGAFNAELHNKLVLEFNTQQNARKHVKTKNSWDTLPQQIRDTRIEELVRLFEAIARTDERIRENSNGLEARIREHLAAAESARSGAKGGSGTGPGPRSRGVRIDAKPQRLLELHLGLNFSQLDRDTAVKAWRTWAVKNHPDKGGNTDLFQEVSNAFDVLKSAMGFS